MRHEKSISFWADALSISTADNGNRTRVSSLGSSHSASEPYPHSSILMRSEKLSIRSMEIKTKSLEDGNNKDVKKLPEFLQPEKMRKSGRILTDFINMKLLNKLYKKGINTSLSEKNNY